MTCSAERGYQIWIAAHETEELSVSGSVAMSDCPIIVAAIALLAMPAQAERGERDPDKMAAIAATILIF
jgi:hypothetical protein